MTVQLKVPKLDILSKSIFDVEINEIYKRKSIGEYKFRRPFFPKNIFL